MKREVKNSKICILPVALISNQAFEKGDRLPSLPSLDPDQVGNLPEIQSLSLNSFIKTPEEIGFLPFLGIFLPAKDTKQWKEIPFKPLVFKWKKIEEGEGGVTCGSPFIIEKRPNSNGTLFFNALAIFS